MNYSKLLFPLVIYLLAAPPAAADWPVGLWQSPPDTAGLVVHVRTKPCGRSICGQIERTKNRFGYDTPSSFVGRRMLMDMQIQPDGSYQGQMWEPHGNRLVASRMQVQGNIMQFQNCDSGGCVNVDWTRLR
ncbi:DUF2147 domain-containing protein [Sulfitobacter mediterraneus]|uniref:Uncharacterized protein DUF2147 n=1 Tax=Sulfitobacter mediterraneus TaxID=83219 RepID=A0A2T6CD46_9RHOB|nr:DUF2147 domain-containing protein [Sulfitobacter mediterraneus]PTX73423.1 uncharacterized protein DUF2147 [Sulfitobacter mediterraneus]